MKILSYPYNDYTPLFHNPFQVLSCSKSFLHSFLLRTPGPSNTHPIVFAIFSNWSMHKIFGQPIDLRTYISGGFRLSGTRYVTDLRGFLKLYLFYVKNKYNVENNFKKNMELCCLIQVLIFSFLHVLENCIKSSSEILIGLDEFNWLIIVLSLMD